jgi:hypothetical protein
MASEWREVRFSEIADIHHGNAVIGCQFVKVQRGHFRACYKRLFETR